MRRRAIFNNASRIIAVSEATRDDVREVYGEAIASKVTVIHNPVDVDDVRALSKVAQVPELIPTVLRGARYCMYVGNRIGAKNFAEVRTVLAADAYMHIVVVGPPLSRKDVRFIGEDLTRVHFVGPVADGILFALLASSEFLFFPSTQEGFGIPIVESMALGVPVLALKNKTIAEVSGGAAYYFETGDKLSVASALRAIRSDRQDQERYRLIVDRYRPEVIVPRYAETFARSVG